jgi:hypothetical protein
MSMQNNLGKLTEAVDGLKSRQTEQATKLDGISHKIYAAIALIVVFGAILSFFAKSINDVITERLLAPALQERPVSQTGQSAPQQPTPQNTRR